MLAAAVLVIGLGVGLGTRESSLYESVKASNLVAHLKASTSGFVYSTDYLLTAHLKLLCRSWRVLQETMSRGI